MGRHRVSIPGLNIKQGIDKLQDLTFLVQQLDSIRAFRRTGTSALDESFQRVNLTDNWQKIKPDVEKITYFPHTIPQIFRLIKIVAFLRTLFPVCFFSIILSILIMIGIFPVTNRIIPPILIIFPFLILISFIVFDLTIRIKIVQHEKKSPNLHNNEKERIRKTINELISKLSKKIKSRNEAVSDYRLRLFFDDYKGIEILKKKRDKVFGIFKKKYFIYIAIPSSKR